MPARGLVMMTTTLDRRHGERARIPCKIPVELTDDRHRGDPFEADAVDLSVGGLSLRAQTLPAVGSHLWCSFEAMPGGATVLGRGEVVWSQPIDADGGEFGLRFVELDAKAQALIDEMVAERIARIDTPFAGRESVVANLEIENVDSPIAAKLVHSSDSEALFEQPLDLLAIGRGVTAHAGVSLVRGSIARVDVRMDGGTPMLALTVSLGPQTQRFGEYDWDGDSPDTRRDLFAPVEPADEEVDEVEELSMSVAPSAPEQVAPRMAAGRDDQLSLVFKHEQREQDGDAEENERLRLALRGDDGEEADEPPLTAADDDEEAEAAGYHSVAVEYEPWSHPAPESGEPTGLVRVLRVFAGAIAGLQRTAAPLANAAQRFTGVRQRIVSGAEKIVAKARPRRVTTAGSNRESSETRGTLRLLGLGLMSLVAVGLFAYALAPNDADESHHRATPDVIDDVSAVSTVPSGMAPLAKAADPATTPPLTAAVPAAGAVPAGSPYTVELRKAAAPAKSDPNAKRNTEPAKPSAAVNVFGHKVVPNAKRFSLRMNAPVTSLQGSADKDGFSVIVPSGHAIDRAAPIAAGNPSIARAMILNRADRAELHVRFARGKNPPYRVSAQGNALEVLIGN
ncbi:MAG TPA: PilZ domain-containing protein [Polyangiales bacterium]